MKKKIREIIERNIDIDNNEIVRLIQEGFTSGILYNEVGYRIVWTLKVDKFED